MVLIASLLGRRRKPVSSATVKAVEILGFQSYAEVFTYKVFLQRLELVQKAEIAFDNCSARSLYRFFRCPVPLLQPFVKC